MQFIKIDSFQEVFINGLLTKFLSDTIWLTCCSLVVLMIFRGMMLHAAILTVNDDKFWKGVKPLEFGDMPAPGEKITVTGYPHGADYVSVIKGCVSGVSMKRYAISEANLPAFEVVPRKSQSFFLS